MFNGPIVLKTEPQMLLEARVRETIDRAASLPRPEGATRLTVQVELDPTFARECGYPGDPCRVRPLPLACTVDLPAETRR